MPIRLSETQCQFVGALVATILGLVLFVVGGRLIVYEYLLAEPAKVSGVVVNSGTTLRSSGGSVNFVRYKFVDQSGTTHNGTSSGYSGKKGESILIEYSTQLPYVHRVAGESKARGYQWRWLISGFGLLFLIAGTHWWWTIRSRLVD